MSKKSKPAGPESASKESAPDASQKLKSKPYEKQLRKLQAELCHLQEWVKHKGLRVIIVFEGRDTSGKGGLIKAIIDKSGYRGFLPIETLGPGDPRAKVARFLTVVRRHFG